MTTNHAQIYTAMRELTHEMCAKGCGAVETNDKIREKFGEKSPTLCTIYKWRREYRGGKGEREANIDDAEEAGLKPIKQKKTMDKYCTPCNRELSTRQYYEFHMLKVHDVLLGESKPTMDFLDQYSPVRRQNLIFRCDACFGGKLDYDTIEELKQHKLLEHGQHMRMPKWNDNTEPEPKDIKPLSLTKQQILKSPSVSFANALPKFPKLSMGREFLRRDKSLPAGSTLRRSARIPKPTSPMLHSLLLAKEITADVNGTMADENQQQQETTEGNGANGANKNVGGDNGGNGTDAGGGGNNAKQSKHQATEESQQQQPSRGSHSGSGGGGVVRRVGFKENGILVMPPPPPAFDDSSEQQNGANAIPPSTTPVTSAIAPIQQPSLRNGKTTFKNEPKHPQNSGTSAAKLVANTSVTSDAETGEAALVPINEPFVTILNDGRLEIEQPSQTQQQQKKKTSHGKKAATQAAQKTRMLSPAALDAADSMLKLAFATPSNPARLLPPANGTSGTEKSAVATLIAELNGDGTISTTKNSPAPNPPTTTTIMAVSSSSFSSSSSSSTSSSLPQFDDGNGSMAHNGGNGNSDKQQHNGNGITAGNVAADKVVVSPPPPPSSLSLAAPSAVSCTVGGAMLGAISVPQDDSTWFGHSVAAQIRMMPAQKKEWVKMRIQQVIFDCITVEDANGKQ